MGIYIVNGAPGSGKDTFCEKVVSITTSGYGRIFSTVDIIKQIAIDLGWNGEKDLKSRKFLSDLKDLLTEWDDIPVKDVKKKIESFYDYLETYGLDIEESAVFIMCREPEEIKRLCEELNAKSLLIRRETAENNETSNHADSNVLNYDYDIVIENNGSLSDLAFKALDFVEKEELHILHWKNFGIDIFGNFYYN